jgi:shikimate kinase
MERVSKKQNRPLLKTADPRAVMQKLMDERYPVYAGADATVVTRQERKEVIADEVVAALWPLLGLEREASRAEERQ